VAVWGVDQKLHRKSDVVIKKKRKKQKRVLSSKLLNVPLNRQDKI
jgi:hypothetical protein